MPKASGFLVEGKPIVQVGLTSPFARPESVAPQSGSAILQIREFRALLDTGADITCIGDRVVRDLGLRHHGFADLRCGTGKNKHKTYIIQVGVWCEDYATEIPEFDTDPQSTKTLWQLKEPVEAAAINDNSWFDMILGTDVLSQYELSLKGSAFTFTLS